MSTVIAVVTQVTGQVWARGVDGSMRAIEVGEALLQGETLITEAGANVVLDFGNGELFQLAGEQSLLMTPNVSAGTEPQVTESMLMDPSVADVLAALEGEGDLLEELEAPAAGTDGAPDGGGSSFVRLTRISESVDPLAYSFDPTSEPGFEAPIGEGGALDELSPPVVATISLTLIELDEDGIPLLNESGGFILVDGDSVIEGTPVGVLASVDIPPSGSPLVIQLGDGLGEIIIPVGGTSGFTPIEIRPDDVYIQDDDLIGVVIESATGGGYDQINTSAESDLVVVDDEDTVTVSITSDGDVTEAEPIAFTVSVSEALDRDLTVTLSTGDQVV
ncbi:retention module-containing protein, partial [Nitrincola tapanii]